MHHLPRILAGKSRESSPRAEMEPRKVRGRRKLERRNAMKNIEYDAATYYSDNGTPSASSSEFFDDKTSFRIEGVEGEFERIFRSLDLTGIDDFSIPAAEWEEAMKARSMPDYLPRAGFFELESPSVSKPLERGIKGARPSPVVKPPISMALPKPNSSSPSWDAPRNLLSESSSFTTSLDDDSSSSTTDIYNISPNSQFKRVITDWEKGKLLGSGSFGSVYEGIAEDGFFFAVKEVSLLDQGMQAKQSVSQLQQEIDLLSQFEHENIVQYYGTSTEPDGSKIYIFLELVSQGSLLSLYHRYHLKDSQVSAYTRQILHGLKYLHDRNVVHRDIKCANILVDANGSVKLADFGLAKATKLNDVRSSKGTPFWMAPEVVNRPTNGYGLQPDIWSLGCTVLEMLTRQFPYFEAEGPMQALFRIGEGIPPSVPESLSSDARDFVLSCLKVDPFARPTATELLDHAFVKRPLSLLSGASSPYVGRRSR